MFSLDAVVWKGKRSEHEAALRKAKQQGSSSSLPRVANDKKIKQLYGKTPQEMYTSYLERVDQWTRDAPAQDWTKAYDKESYPRAYVPRERVKDKDLGGPAVTVGSYSPRGVYKGGGKCVRHIVDPKAPDPGAHLPRELYRQRIANFEKAREKHKELHPPMAIPTNKPLACGKFFVRDVLCCTHVEDEDGDNDNQRAGCRKCAARCASPERTERDDDERADAPRDVTKRPFYRPIHSRVGHSGDARAEPPPTAEYVASPQWRAHSPHKWLARDFTATTASSNAHTATVAGISGAPYRPSLLIADKFAARSRGEITPTSPAVRAFEHERRARTAALALRIQRSPQRAPRNYFSSMWTEPPAGVTGGGCGGGSASASASRSPVPSTRVAGRELVLALREQARASPPKPSSPVPRA
ncbi:hypothetical protein PybrP1_012472 [[Pythium] brassicae (nom. inval.)]|nr:hypothetical protein PybrP1_012472 [[Pythium] brassicae (nom. inval.)]